MKNNLFANGLLILIGVLLLLAAFQMLGWGQGTATIEPEAFDISSLNQLEVSGDGLAEAVDDKSIVQITDAPLFSIDRKPFVPPDDISEETGEGDMVLEPEPLQAKVTSIIITDENSYAMVFDQLSNQRVTLKQGMPLPGEQGLWVVDKIDPRAVTFAAEGKESVELELEVFNGQLNAAAPKNNRRAKRRNNQNPQQANNDNSKAQKNSAEEIRKKIAERRAQMRANAAKGKENDK